MDDRRMKLEELLLSLTYVDYESTQNDFFKAIQIYQQTTSPITFRVERPKIDHWLDTIDNNKSENKDSLNQTLSSIKNVESFIKKTR